MTSLKVVNRTTNEEIITINYQETLDFVARSNSAKVRLSGVLRGELRAEKFKYTVEKYNIWYIPSIEQQIDTALRSLIKTHTRGHMCVGFFV